MKILISRPDKIGDVVLALHGVKQLKQKLPHAKVYVHVSPYTRALVENINFIDGAIEIGTDLAPYKFDAVVDLMAKNETSSLYTNAPIKIKIGNSARWFRHRYNRTRYIRRSYAMLNEAEYNWQLISLLDKSLKNTPLREVLNKDDFKQIAEYSQLTNYTVLMPGVSVSAKGWELNNWLDLADLISKSNPVVILLGPAEKDLADKFAPLAKSNPEITVKVTETFPEVLGLLKNCKNYIGTSTGVTHLASAVGANGIALYPEARSMHPRRWLPFETKLIPLSLSKGVTPQNIIDRLSGTLLQDLDPMPRAKISAFVVCCNEEKNIGRCLESIKWCDEIIIVDSGSKDRTLEIASHYTDKIFHRIWNGHSEQKQFALNKCQYEWVLNIDSDEEASPELRAQIIRILSLEPKKREQIKGYYINRVVYFLGRWWEHGGWYPEYRLRFFQLKHTKWGGVNPHEKAIVTGKTRYIKEPIYHFTYQDFFHQINTLNKHSSLSAECLYREGKRCHLHNLIANPLFRFFKFYFLKQGFREGLPGLIVAGIEASYTFFKYLKLWELERLSANNLLKTTNVSKLYHPDEESESKVA